jgi:hypothetical protein
MFFSISVRRLRAYFCSYLQAHRFSLFGNISPRSLNPPAHYCLCVFLCVIWWSFWLSSSSFMSCSSSFASGLSSLYIHARVCGGIRVVLFSFSRSSGILSSVLNSCFSRRAHSRGRRLDDGHRLRSAERIRPAVNRAHASQDVRGAHAPHGHAPHADDPRAVNTPGHHQPSRVVAAQHSTRCI